MRAVNFKDFLKSLNTKFDNYYCGRLDTKKLRSVGVYSLRNDCKIPIGGENNRKTFSESFSVLIHWDNNYDNTEKKARELQNELQTIQNVKYGGFDINFIRLSYSEPIDVSSDDKGVFERVIELTVYYNKEV